MLPTTPLSKRRWNNEVGREKINNKVDDGYRTPIKNDERTTKPHTHNSVGPDFIIKNALATHTHTHTIRKKQERTERQLFPERKSRRTFSPFPRLSFSFFDSLWLPLSNKRRLGARAPRQTFLLLRLPFVLVGRRCVRFLLLLQIIEKKMNTRRRGKSRERKRDRAALIKVP